jgi:phenylalanyl-tRNA synthetase beta chain
VVTIAVIEIGYRDLQELLGHDVSIEKLEDAGSMLGILFEDVEKEDVIEVEVEPNRPDLLSAEGIARALDGFFEYDTGLVEYPVKDGDVAVTIDASVETVRPHIACATITGLDLDTPALNSIIQLQEKLTATYGRKRKKVAIGLHDAANITNDITYRAVDPDSVSFIPLEHEDAMTLTGIVEQHEKGQEYGWIVDDYDRYPLIVDSDDTVLSFPPVINGAATEVTTDTSEIFLDVTGTSRREVETALNIVVAALSRRGGTIESVDIGGDTCPDMAPTVETIDPDYVQQISGLDDLSSTAMAEQLAKMNYGATVDGTRLQVEVPAYRADIMHPYDIIEDIVIGYGYDSIDPQLPDIATVGGKTAEQAFTDRLREFMVGTGAQELMTFILTNEERLFDRMALEVQDIVRMANPLTEEYTVVRNWLLPSLMDALANNQHNRYPQTVFEIGKCSRLTDTTHSGADDFRKLAYATAATDVGFSDARSVLQSLAAYLGVDLTVEEADHGSFADERCGAVFFDDKEVGVIGEISDPVRENWELDDIRIAAFELDVTAVTDRIDA